MLMVPSRFECLESVEDDFITKPKQKAPKKDNVKKPEEKKTKTVAKPNKVSNAKSNNTSVRKKNPSASNEQWEQWKMKDCEYIEGSFKDDLEQALRLSKLEFDEEKKKICRKKTEDGTKSSKKKKKIMTLSEFNSLSSSPQEKNFIDYEDRSPSEEPKIRINNLVETPMARSPPTNDEIKGSQLQVVLDQRNKELNELKAEVVLVKAELLKVKNRNKQLCSIIGVGEMNEKADLIEEIDRIKEINADLMTEVQSLHKQLEQERSKGPQNKDLKIKDKQKK